MDRGESKPVPFYVLCGSLGAGKTTFLMRLLEYWNAQGRRVGVLMNEAGEVSIDGPRAGTIAEQVLNLAGGCVCCDTKEDLSWGIAQLVKDYESDIIVLECSGMADPVEVVDAVTDLYTARLVQLERVIALLQPLSSEQSSSHAYVTSQAIRCADEVILNKRDLYVPLEVSPEERVARQSHWLTVVGRLRDGITLEQAAGVIEGVSARAQKELEGRDPRSLAPFTLVPLRDHQVGNAKAALWLLLGAGGCVLLIGCANVSNLMVAKATARRKEIAMRLALGAGRVRILKQLLVESAVLALAGGVLGLALAFWSLDLLQWIAPRLPLTGGIGIPGLDEIRVNLPVLAFTMGLSLGAGLLFGVVPAWQGYRRHERATAR